MSVEASSVAYEVTHTTEYEYSQSVSVSHHVARLTPRTLPHQRCLRHAVDIDPMPAVSTTHVDAFGNTVTFFAMQGAHERLVVQAASRVVVSETSPPKASETPSWETAIDRARLPLDAIECTFDSPYARANADLAAYARASFSSGRPLLDAVVELTARIHDEFTFDPRATTVSTPVAEVFKSRRGVCQDFAHLEIACLRAMGLAAHYVSGYLETLPPPGRPRQVGADVSHAWLACYCPTIGWIDVDPTNNLLPKGSHVTLAWGRDYGDISPIRGVILGGGDHSLRVKVDVVRVETEDTLDTSSAV